MSYNLRPETHELEKARKNVEKAFESCKYTLEKNKVLSVNLGSSWERKHGAHGLAESSTEAQIYFSPDVSGWGEDLKKTAISVYGEAWYRENVDEVAFVWQSFLASVSGLLLLEEVEEGREPEREGLGEEWMEKKDSLDEEVAFQEESFSWSLKLVLGRKLIDEEGPEGLSDLSRSDVVEAGEEAFE
jgi:hypothetical protein